MKTRDREGVRLERTGWRDMDISERHRAWGFDCPAVDLDFVMAEYNHGLPVAIVEYKHRGSFQPNYTHPTFQALTALANGYKDGPLPLLVAFYDPVEWWFRVIPVNYPAQQHYRNWAGKPISEQQFVKSLYLLRKKVLDKADLALLRRLNKFIPESEE